MSNARLWLHGLVAAAIGGAAGALTVAADGISMNHAGMMLLLRQPAESVTKTTTQTETETLVKN